MALSNALYLVAFGIAGLLAFELAWKSVDEAWLGFDFEGTLWDPAVASLEGQAPYPEPVVSEVEVGNPALYPPLLFLLVTPLTLLPWTIGLTVWIAILGAAVVGTLYLLGVRDVRCYVVALVAVPTVEGVLWSNATLCSSRSSRSHGTGAANGSGPARSSASLWRPSSSSGRSCVARRDSEVPGGGGGARVRNGGVTSALGGDRILRAEVLSRSSPCRRGCYATHSFSTATMFSALGAGGSVATAGTLGLGACGALTALIVGRSGRDELALFIALLAAVLGSPIVWTYYYVLLLIPLAIARPRFSALWLLPMALWVTRMFPRQRLVASEFEPGGSACCRPDDVPIVSWVSNHSPPGLWPALGHAAVALLLVAFLTWRLERTSPAA